MAPAAGTQVIRGARLLTAAGAPIEAGFIDAHTHLGISEESIGWEGRGTNELTDPVTLRNIRR